MDNSEQYQVYIDLNNVTIVGGDGFESQLIISQEHLKFRRGKKYLLKL